MANTMESLCEDLRTVIDNDAGAFILVLLPGHRVTTHWIRATELLEKLTPEYLPELTVEDIVTGAVTVAIPLERIIAIAALLSAAEGTLGAMLAYPGDDVIGTEGLYKRIRRCLAEDWSAPPSHEEKP